METFFADASAIVTIVSVTANSVAEVEFPDGQKEQVSDLDQMLNAMMYASSVWGNIGMKDLRGWKFPREI